MLKRKLFFSLITGFAAIIVLSSPRPAFSQDTIGSRVEMFGSAATGSTTPFWLVNNTHGLVPLKANNAYLEGEVFWKRRLNKNFRLNIDADLVAVTRHSSDFFVRQLYGELVFKSLHLTVGSKEQYHSMLDKSLSSGDFVFSPNARPIPEINLSIPEFTNVPLTKGILQFRGDFAVGKSLENNYVLNAKAPGEDYSLDVLLHHKSVLFLISDPVGKFPFSLTWGVEHAVQWGGWSSYYNMGEMPHSFNDLKRVIFGNGGGDDAPGGEQINRLGNHLGTYNVKLDYKARNFDAAIYKQHYFDDNSGMEYANWSDGIWGMECSFVRWSYLKKIVFEYINTTHQSGVLHFMFSDRPGVRGGGNDDYYSHLLYGGWSYWGRTLGNPLITSPEYNNDGSLDFKNNRVKALHLGFEGDINKHISYRLLATNMNAWGRMSYPFREKKTDFSMMMESAYSCPQWKGWKIGVQLAFDRGTLYGDNFGGTVKVSKAFF